MYIIRNGFTVMSTQGNGKLYHWNCVCKRFISSSVKFLLVKCDIIFVDKLDGWKLFLPKLNGKFCIPTGHFDTPVDWLDPRTWPIFGVLCRININWYLSVRSLQNRCIFVVLGSTCEKRAGYSMCLFCPGAKKCKKPAK